MFKIRKYRAIKVTEMKIGEILSVILTILASICFLPFMMYIVFPFFESFTPEKKLEKLIEQQCLLGNEIAIQIRRDNFRYYANSDYKLVRAAIEGNVNAAKALKLDNESLKKKRIISDTFQ